MLATEFTVTPDAEIRSNKLPTVKILFLILVTMHTHTTGKHPETTFLTEERFRERILFTKKLFDLRRHFNKFV
jgi:hypothetical protein